jgi:hypothetical protein
MILLTLLRRDYVLFCVEKEPPKVRCQFALLYQHLGVQNSDRFDEE